MRSLAIAALVVLAACGPDVNAGFGVTSQGTSVSGKVVDYGREITYQFTAPQQYHCESGRVRKPSKKEIMHEVLVSCIGVGYGTLVTTYAKDERQLVGIYALNDGQQGRVIFNNYKP